MNTPVMLDFDWFGLTPIILVLGVGAVQVLLEAFVPRKARWYTQVVVSALTLVTAFAVTVAIWASGDYLKYKPLAGNEVVADQTGLFAWIILLLVGFLSVLVFADKTSQRDGAFAAQPADRPGSADEDLSIRVGYQRSEIFPLLMFSLGGMMVFVQAESLLTLFVALEVMSLPLYIMAASARRRRLISQEAGLKYFILGAFASAFFLMGAALYFFMLGTVGFGQYQALSNGAPLGKLMQDVAMQHAGDRIPLLVIAILLIVVGLLFKVAAVPFHAWTPDVYQGAPTPVTGFMAAGVKVAAFVALLRISNNTFVWMHGANRWIIWTIAGLTIVYGTVMGLRQTNVKRMLAYSSIAHAGFLLTALAGTSGQPAGVYRPTLFYLLAYGVASVGAFGVVTLVRDRNASGDILGEATDMRKWAGLGKSNPILAVCMTVFLLSFAGIPFTAGFIGKFWVFLQAVSVGGTPLVVIAVLASAATAVFYFRLIKIMFFDEARGQAVVVQSQGFTSFAVVLSALITVLLGIAPSLVLGLL